MKNIPAQAFAAALSLAVFFAPHPSAAAEMEVQVQFSSLPEAVQQTLAAEVDNISNAADARVYMGMLDGTVVYTGRVRSPTGEVQTINVDEDGNLLYAQKLPASDPRPVSAVR